MSSKTNSRLKRKKNIRGKISGTKDRPRVTVFKSNKYFYSQAINDVAAETIAAASGTKDINTIEKVAKELASELKKNKTTTVVFDRNGYKFHGRIESFVNKLRDNGITI